VIATNTEPIITVGLMSGANSSGVVLKGAFETADGLDVPEGHYVISQLGGAIRADGPTVVGGPSLSLRARELESCRGTLDEVVIGVDFHWQRREAQTFQGTLTFVSRPEGITIVNELPLESYLVSVISSEMSASCPPELLRAHAIVSRSWLLAQLAGHKEPAESTRSIVDHEIVRWYGRESHAGFDVCADDHCQRYQGISKAFSRAAFDAVEATRGVALMWGEEICDARYSKSCGGMTEIYRAAWEDRDVPYLNAVYDGPGRLAGFAMPLADHANAAAWITSSPPAYCNADSAQSGELLARLLPDFDQETRDFYRWEIVYSQEEISEILVRRTGIDFGRVKTLRPLARGESGRITRLEITGEKRSVIIGKELEIRRALSRSHLYSSAFVVLPEADRSGSYPDRFRLKGAGWGHGVGLCQIGAAVMAELGHSYKEILDHFFRGSGLRTLY
jgi:peptidoglycan hydrolase-like amidase